MPAVAPRTTSQDHDPRDATAERFLYVIRSTAPGSSLVAHGSAAAPPAAHGCLPARRGLALASPEPITTAPQARARPTPRRVGELTSYTTDMTDNSAEARNDRDPSFFRDLIQREENTLSRLLEWVRAIDSKVPVVMAIATGMLGVLAAIAPAPKKELTSLAVLWIGVGAAPLLMSLGLCAMATFPQTGGPPGSLIYFGGIASHPQRVYSQAVLERSDQEYLEDLLGQCHRNAEIAKGKYKFVRWALIWLLAGVRPGSWHSTA